MELQEWNPKEKAKLPARFLIISKTNSGKSFFLRWLIKELEDQIGYVIVFCPTAFNGDWNNITDEVYDTWRPDYVEAIIEKRKQAIMNGKKPHNILIVLDDCLESGTIDLQRDHLLNRLMAQGRHTFCSVALISQKLTKLSTVIRANAEYVIFLSWCNMKEFEAYFEEYSNVQKEQFKKMFEEYCHSYQAIIYDNTGYNVEWHVKKADDVGSYMFPKFHKKKEHLRIRALKEEEQKAKASRHVVDAKQICERLSKFEEENMNIPKLSKCSSNKNFLRRCKRR